jgi:hypothetical protein
MLTVEKIRREIVSDEHGSIKIGVGVENGQIEYAKIIGLPGGPIVIKTDVFFSLCIIFNSIYDEVLQAQKRTEGEQ